jgi:acyl carrier protein
MRTYLTGDLGIMRPDGCLEYRGRKDFHVKIRGHNVDIGEVEARLTSLGDIKEAVVASRQKSDGETYLVAYVVPERQQFPTAGSLRRALADRLPGPMIPSSFVILDALPQTPNGKIDRRRLPEPGNVRPAVETAYVDPRTSMEKQVAAIWIEVLALDRVGFDDNFFDLGGHSLAAARILSRVRSAFHIDLPVKTFFDRPTIAETAQAIVAEQASCAESIDQLLSELEEMADSDSLKL